MTAFDIYSALGNVSEELLEESEFPVAKAKPKGVLYMTAAAACFAVLAVGLHFALNDSGIAAPDQGEVVTIGETHITADVTQYTSPAIGETTRSETTHAGVVSISSDGLPIDVTGPVTGIEANADDTYKYEADETTLPETGTTANMTTASTANETAQDEEETAIVPRWADMSDMERYVYLQYNGNEYSITMDKFDESELTFLQNGKLYGFDEEHAEDCEGPVRRDMRCAFYKIKNVNENYMIAALTADGCYTAFRNHSYRPDTLGSYLEDIDFSNRCKLTTIHSETSTLIGDELQTQYFEYRLPDLQQAVEKLLAENSNAVPEINPPPVLDIYLIICGDDTFPTVRISEGGYVGVLGKYFKIGEDKTESFMAYIEENSVKRSYDPRAGADPNEPMIPE